MRVVVPHGHVLSHVRAAQAVCEKRRAIDVGLCGEMIGKVREQFADRCGFENDGPGARVDGDRCGTDARLRDRDRARGRAVEGGHVVCIAFGESRRVGGVCFDVEAARGAVE